MKLQYFSETPRQPPEVFFRKAKRSHLDYSVLILCPTLRAESHLIETIKCQYLDIQRLSRMAELTPYTTASLKGSFGFNDEIESISLEATYLRKGAPFPRIPPSAPGTMHRVGLDNHPILLLIIRHLRKSPNPGA